MRSYYKSKVLGINVDVSGKMVYFTVDDTQSCTCTEKPTGGKLGYIGMSRKLFANLKLIKKKRTKTQLKRM